ncbi:MAG TPA: MFS transporter [Candidatus Limnocylindria bacterium]|jgi:MFS family permease|nr:MFS transporter [Candidatus Limnocylindria bacterium]
MTLPERTELTYRSERWRSLCAGVLETAGNTFLLLIATRWLQAGQMGKAAIAAGTATGLLLTPLSVNAVQYLGWNTTRAVYRLLLLGTACCLAMAAFPILPIFVPAAVIAMAANTCAIPLMTQVYHENYPPEGRGRLYSRTFMLRIAAAIVFAFLAGQFLEPDLAAIEQWSGHPLPQVRALMELFPERFRVLLLVFAGAFAVAAVAVKRIPSTPLAVSNTFHPLRSLRTVRDDRFFRQALIAWMLMGFANLAMLPMRVEYLGNPKYGLAKTAAQIAWLTLVIPNLARLIMSPVWGALFDRMNFFTLRVALNLGFALGIAAFFTTNSSTGLIVGAIIYGISNAGGDVAWGLWVTKFAPPNRVADYMSIHTFTTGIRGVLAPVVAFHVVEHYSPATMGWISGAMILAATIILVPEIWALKASNKAALLNAADPE